MPAINHQYYPFDLREKKNFLDLPHKAILHFTTVAVWDSYANNDKGGTTNVSMVRYYAFEDDITLADWVAKNEKEQFQIISVTPVGYKKTVTIDIA